MMPQFRTRPMWQKMHGNNISSSGFPVLFPSFTPDILSCISEVAGGDDYNISRIEVAYCCCPLSSLVRRLAAMTVRQLAPA